MRREGERAPRAEELVLLEPAGWPEDAVSEELVGDWRIYQRRGGHRASTDDVVTAWMATRMVARRGAPADRYLDLGCGVGSVLLLTAHKLRPRRSVGVEAQIASAKMAARSVAELPGAPAIEILRADLRDADPCRGEPFDLVTGSPPYFPLGTGVLAADPQRRAARFELRGGVEAYVAAAARALSPAGSFALVFPARDAARALDAAAREGLALRDRVDLLMREADEAPFLSVLGFSRSAGDAVHERFAIRGAGGRVTREYEAARASLDLR